MSIQATRPNWIRPVAGISAAIYGSACALSIMPAMMSPMLFDAPGSTERVLLWILMGVLLTLPIDLLGATVALGLAAWKHWRMVTLIALAMPILHVLAIVVLFALL